MFVKDVGWWGTRQGGKIKKIKRRKILNSKKSVLKPGETKKKKQEGNHVIVNIIFDKTGRKMKIFKFFIFWEEGPFGCNRAICGWAGRRGKG